MPLTEKGRKIKAEMKDQYGPEKGEEVFHASRNKGTIEGVESNSSSNPNPLPPPERGGTPKRIGEDMGEPGGPHTPGAKEKRRKKAAKKKAAKKKANRKKSTKSADDRPAHMRNRPPH